MRMRFRRSPATGLSIDLPTGTIWEFREPFPWCRGPRRAQTSKKTPESSAPRPYIGYVSSQWHTRQPHTPQQLAATSWCRSHPYPTTERAVSVPRSTEGKTPPNPPKTMAECSTAAHGPWAPQKHRRSARKGQLGRRRPSSPAFLRTHFFTSLRLSKSKPLSRWHARAS